MCLIRVFENWVHESIDARTITLIQYPLDILWLTYETEPKKSRLCVLNGNGPDGIRGSWYLDYYCNSTYMFYYYYYPYWIWGCGHDPRIRGSSSRGGVVDILKLQLYLLDQNSDMLCVAAAAAHKRKSIGVHLWTISQPCHYLQGRA